MCSVRLSVVLLACVAASAESSCGQDALEVEVRRRVAEAPRTHPRLFLDAEGWTELSARLEGDALLRAGRDHVLAVADLCGDAEPLRREQVGRRLLGVSRACLKRVVHLAFAWRVTGERRYAERAALEMRTVAGFTDWNPSHFLDVAEMTAALAIGYDWTYDALSEEDRAAVRRALVELGLEPGLRGGWWVDTTNNWNQVCHGGLSLGALAVLEDEPDLAARVVERAVRKLPRAMGEYAPDGAYPEGPSYWNYGTVYNALVLGAYGSVFETDFGLAESAEGFLETPGYYQHVSGPTGLFFNYSDCGKRGGLAPAMYWFARRSGDPGLLHRELELLRGYLGETEPEVGGRDRLLPFALLWCPALQGVVSPDETAWVGQGRTPVALLRTGWSPEATFVGVKAGSPGSNHAHMDVGSFVIDALGVRWAEDLGSQSYHSLESKGLSLWDRAQGSERWSVFRLATAAHNVLMVDGEDQRVRGKGVLREVSSAEGGRRVSVDLSEVYAGQLASASREVELVRGGTARGGTARGDTVRIEDRFTAPAFEDAGRRCSVRWGMLTRAEVEIVGPRRAVLRRDGRVAEVRLETSAGLEGVRWEVVDTSAPRAEHDAANPGTRMLVFRVELAAGEVRRSVVVFEPGER